MVSVAAVEEGSSQVGIATRVAESYVACETITTCADRQVDGWTVSTMRVPSRTEAVGIVPHAAATGDPSTRSVAGGVSMSAPVSVGRDGSGSSVAGVEQG